ncbi:MAG TPA: hypothetical protein VIK40_08280 [Geomonas sp.]
MNRSLAKTIWAAHCALLLLASAVNGADAAGNSADQSPLVPAAGAGKDGKAAAIAPKAAAPVAAEDEDADEDEKSEETPAGIAEQIKELKQQVDKLRKEGEARKRLEVSEEEKQKKAEDILTAAGREYTLLKKGTLSLEYSFNYSYFSGDVIKAAAIVEQRSNHNITNQIYTEYALRDNFSVNFTLPFAYKYNRVGTDTAQEATDFGDLSFGVQSQPVKAGGDVPAAILSAGVTCPFGSSPYRINPDTALATGSGFYSVNAGVSLSKTMDPLVAFGNLSYNYSFAADGLNQNWKDGRNLTRVEPGSNVGLAMGFGYALSYKASLNMSAQFAYAFGNQYHFSNAASYGSGSSTSASFNIGTGWKITPARSIALKLGIGLTSNDPDFSFSIRVPFEM